VHAKTCPAFPFFLCVGFWLLRVRQAFFFAFLNFLYLSPPMVFSLIVPILFCIQLCWVRFFPFAPGQCAVAANTVALSVPGRFRRASTLKPRIWISSFGSHDPVLRVCLSSFSPDKGFGFFVGFFESGGNPSPEG